MTTIKKSTSLVRLILIGLIVGALIGAGLGAVIGANSPSPDQYNAAAVSDPARERLKTVNAPAPAFTKFVELVGGSPTLAGGLLGGTGFGILGAGLALLSWLLRRRNA